MRSLSLALACLAAPALAQDCEPEAPLSGEWQWTSGPGTANTSGMVMNIPADDPDPVTLDIENGNGTITSVVDGNDATIYVTEVLNEAVDLETWSASLPSDVASALDTLDVATLTVCDVSALPQYAMKANARVEGVDMQFEYDMIRFNDDLIWGYESTSLIAGGIDTVITRTVTISR